MEKDKILIEGDKKFCTLWTSTGAPPKNAAGVLGDAPSLLALGGGAGTGDAPPTQATQRWPRALTGTTASTPGSLEVPPVPKKAMDPHGWLEG